MAALTSRYSFPCAGAGKPYDLVRHPREIPQMKTLLIAAAAYLSLAGSVFAQGLPPGSSPPEYASHAFPNAQYENETVFSKLLGHFKSSDHAPDETPNNGR
jgi:hypothetical protein